MTLKQLALGIGTTAFATITVVGVYAAAQTPHFEHGSFLAQDGPGGGPGPAGPGGRGRFGGPGDLRGPGRGGPLGFAGPMDLPLGRLNLTDAQKDRVKAINDSFQEEIRATAERARTAREALEAAVTAEPFNEATIRARSLEVSSVEADIAVLRARIRSEVVQVLTAEQKAQAEELSRGGRAGRPGRSGRQGA